ncbi:hypothetical protein MMC21_002743 [Puttea exsequens]|nr:hypothetical protein [Puttea exsequens]
MQTLGAAYFFKTARAGHLKGFYLTGHLSPYSRGVPAWMMYAGALLWTILYFLTIFFVVTLEFVMAEKVRHEAQELGQRLFEPTFRKINDLLVERESYRTQHAENSAQEHGQRLFEPTFRKTNTWLFERESHRTQHAGNATQKFEQRLFEPAFSKANKLSTGRESSRTPEAGNLRARRTLETRVRYHMIGVIEFLSPTYLWVYAWLYERWSGFSDEPTTEDEEIENQRALEALDRLAERRGMGMLHRKAHITRPRSVDSDHPVRNGLTTIVIGLWVLTYISQWLFWAGFVESMGPR